jgi:hypothetical protein
MSAYHALMATPSTLPQWFVTIRTSPSSTADRRIAASSPYAARWLYSQLYPSHTIILIRPSR